MQDFDGYGKAHRLGDHLLSASLGLSVRIGKTGWKRVIDARPRGSSPYCQVVGIYC